jgi:acyl dehydratase
MFGRIEAGTLALMSLDEIIGATYGPYPMRISPEKVAEYVAATGDSAERWERYAPPGYAGALLFVVAPSFLKDRRVKPFTGVLVHVDQTFTWRGPLPIGDQISVLGTVDKVRERAGRFFVTFSATVDMAGGGRLLDCVATFLMGEGSEAEGIPDPGEPPVWRRELNDRPSVTPRPGVGEELAPLSKSASRIDLVKYAAASGDYNPIHFDHDAARNAGLEGIVVHGLLMAAWAMQSATAFTTRPDPLAHVKLRFRNPLRPGAQATVGGAVRDIAEDGGDAQLSLFVSAEDEHLVVASCIVRLDG